MPCAKAETLTSGERLQTKRTGQTSLISRFTQQSVGKLELWHQAWHAIYNY